jgi:hypothetical protein
MRFKKSFFEQMGKQVKDEVANYDAYEESKPVKFKKCKHKQVAVMDGELRCACGAAWRGARIIDLYNKFKGV